MKFKDYIKAVVFGVVPLFVAIGIAVFIVSFVNIEWLQFILSFLIAIMLAFAEIKWVEFLCDKDIIHA